LKSAAIEFGCMQVHGGTAALVPPYDFILCRIEKKKIYEYPNSTIIHLINLGRVILSIWVGWNKRSGSTKREIGMESGLEL